MKKTEHGVEKTITVKWRRSSIGRPENQKKIIKALGFRRLNQTLTLQDRPEIRGMIDHVSHLVEVIE
ncbi:MAG: 50S ribosomal protein L30 [Thermodesulfobacteriota bacterium]|nr:50S ribosomal protein L30 [Thermodesulfobacteriota bacterium]